MEPHMSITGSKHTFKFMDENGNPIGLTQYMQTHKVFSKHEQLFYFGSAPAPEKQMTYEVQTQKAKGIRALEQVVRELGPESMAPLISDIYSARKIADLSDGDFRHFYWRLESMIGVQNQGEGFFMRPCPMRPRHGFVDSRRMPDEMSSAQEAILEIARETINADPDGEIAFHAFIDAAINAVLTTNSVVLGPGHDGATAGKQSITIPIATPKLKETLEPFDLGIGDSESPYLEFVESAKTGLRLPYLTQVRAGPETQCADDYVPFRVKVSQVIPVNGDMDLLEWEAQAQSLKQVKGVVVYHPGGSISSHFGVHCVINEIPYITTHEPKVGDLITNTSEAAWEDSDYAYLAKLIKQYDAMPPRMNAPAYAISEWDSFGGVARFVIAALHGTGSLMQSRSEYAFRTVAAGLVYASKLFNALTLGEFRHAAENTVNETPARMLAEHFGFSGSPERSGRASLYWEAINKPMGRNYAKNVIAYHVYCQPVWADGYGGSSWGECAKVSHEFTNNIMQFVLEPSGERLRSALNSFNVIITLAHNNGWWLNKVIPQATFQDLSRRPALGMVNAFAYNMLNGALPDPMPESKYTLSLERARANEKECLDVLANLPPGLQNPERINTFNYSEPWVKAADDALVKESDRAVIVPFVFDENHIGGKLLTFPFAVAKNHRPLKLNASYVFNNSNYWALGDLLGPWPSGEIGHLLLYNAFAFDRTLGWLIEPINENMRLMPWLKKGIAAPTSQCRLKKYGNFVVLAAFTASPMGRSALDFTQWVDGEPIKGGDGNFFFSADRLKKWQENNPLLSGSMTLNEALERHAEKIKVFVPPLLFGGQDA